jgi:protease-4
MRIEQQIFVTALVTLVVMGTFWLSGQERTSVPLKMAPEAAADPRPGPGFDLQPIGAEAAGVLLQAQEAAGGQDADASRQEQDSPQADPAVQEAADYNVASIRLSGRVHSGPPGVSLLGKASAHEMSLRDWLQRLAKARNDDAVQAVALEIDFPEMDWAQATELADAVSRLDKVKPVYTYMVSGRSVDYLVASAGSHVSLEPAGELRIVGLGAELTFLGETMEWIGIEPQMVQIGDYKGAAEPATRTEPSEQLKSEYNKLLDGLYAQMVKQIADQRGLRPQAVRAAIDAGPLLASQALEHKLVDQLVTGLEWQDQVARHLCRPDQKVAWKQRYGQKKAQSIDLSNPFELLAMLTRGPSQPRTKDPTIAIIHAEGVITMGPSGESLFGGSKRLGHETMVDVFEQVRKDDNVKAVIFRIDSPGGSALASELIYQAASRCAKEKPVIASVGSMAASGGYYIAMGSDTILADPAAIVGSIGVISGKLATRQLLSKLKMHTWEITRGANAGLGFSRPWNARELAKIRKHARSVYDLFVKRVRQSRGQKLAPIDKVAQGRIFTARQGIDLGMVDRIGGLREAVLAAQERIGLDRTHFVELPRPQTLADLLSASTGARAPRIDPLQSVVLKRLLHRRTGIAYLLNLMDLINADRCLTALPYHLEIRR